MKRRFRPDPLDELRHANPDTQSRLPSESKARVWARIQEVTMNDTNHTTPARQRWGIGLGAAAIAGVAALALLVNSGGTPPSPTDDPGTGIGSCVEMYSPAAIADRDFAFDGTVTAINGDQVTFAVNEDIVGSSGDEITLNAAGMIGVTSAGGPNLTEGERYLVAGDDTFAWTCGFTQPYDEAVAAEWAGTTR